MNEGWGWEREDALILYGWYTGLVYFTPLIGGILADKFFGYRNATVMGAFIMALGHGSMALEYFADTFFFLIDVGDSKFCLLLASETIDSCCTFFENLLSKA